MSSATAIISSTACRSRRKREQAAFARAHPDLYERSAGPARLRIEGGKLALGSLACPGFAVAADMDFAAMRPMPAPQAGGSRRRSPRSSHDRGAAPARALRERGGARGLHDGADAGAGCRPCQRPRRHPGARRRRQDGADAGAHGQARGAGQARGRRGALLGQGGPRPAGQRRASRRSRATCSTDARSRRCRGSTTSSTWPP